ncbi:peptidylprolyl isomerase [Corynebacterium sp. HS2168-gen11]|uniref:peptidylprolyl isomerase n=1 Tax=Corynebacterium sp. HS2168-gen11 TaxID=2974027 RepID=UPI00216ABB76|nr:peptidylprolyl isomerase [Corynebacterium sp. HS2168-gen11]MCS4535187.1 peptidylprolyl isomerase [Corynebacterium sp. HS2168-gen11]
MTSNKDRRLEAMHSLEKEIQARDRAEKLKPMKLIAAAAAAIVVIVGGIVVATKYTSEDTTTDQAAANATSAAPATTPEVPNFEPLTLARKTALPKTVSCTYEESGTPAKDAGKPGTENISATGEVRINLETSAGVIGLDLDRSVSPCTVNAIEHLAKAGYYDDTICHRITTSGISVLQCGDPSGTGAGGPGFQFANEYPTDETTEETQQLPVLYSRGTIAMANAGPGTNGSQFFLNYADSPLPPQYTYFGKISEEGLTVLDAIAAKGAKDGASDGEPAEEVRIKHAKVAS